MTAVVVAAAVVFCLTLPNDDSYAADPSGSCGDDLTWTYIESTQTLSIEGTGDMEDFITPPWAEYRIKHVSLPDGLTSIGTHAFQNCRYLTDAASLTPSHP